MVKDFFSTLSSAHKGMMYSLIGYTGFAMSDVSVKILGARYSIYQILSIDFLLAAALLCFVYPLIIKEKTPLTLSARLKTTTLKLHILRGVCNFGVGILFVMGLIALPMATVYTLIFTTPFYAVIITALIYKEKMALYRWGAIAAGFAGILIVVRPTIAGVDLIMLAPLAASLFGALLFVMAKSMRGETDFTMGFYPSFIAGLLCVPLAVYHGFVIPPADDLVFFLISAVGINVGIILVSKAYAVAASAVVAPFHYSQILWGVLFGYFVFSELPDLYTFIGAGVIISSGLYLVFKERTTVEAGA